MAEEHVFLEKMTDWESGTAPVRGRFTEEEEAKAVDLIINAPRFARRKHQAYLEEAITTSDFPSLLGQIVDKKMEAAYKAAVPDWEAYIPTDTVADFNLIEENRIDGNEDELPRIPEKGDYKVAPMSTGKYTGRVYKYGRKFDISWESIINDIMRAFEKMPERFALAARRTEALIATRLLASATGPNAALFASSPGITDPATSKKIVNKGTLKLTIDNLEKVVALAAKQKSPDGYELGLSVAHLIVPKDLELQGRKILTSTRIHHQVTAEPVPDANVLPQMGIQLHVNPLLNRIDTSGNAGTTWYVIVDLAQGQANKALRLRGHETPEIAMKKSDKVTTGGAPMGPYSGDFDTDNIMYRVRHVFGAFEKDPRCVYAQTGTA